MATDSTTPTPEVPEGFMEPMTLDELVKHWAALRLGHEAEMTDKVGKVNQYQFDAAEFARTGVWPVRAAATEGESEMALSIGNREIHNHYHASTETQTTTQAPEATPQVSTPTGSNALGKLAAAGALVASGGIAGLGGALALDYLNKPTETTVITQPAEDTDTNAGLRFKD